jgi:hypothetical protein
MIAVNMLLIHPDHINAENNLLTRKNSISHQAKRRKGDKT